MLAVLALFAAAPTALFLPDANGPVLMDYLAASGRQVWIPAGNTGKVFVLDGPSGKFRSIDGFPTRKVGENRVVGPSSVTIGAGYAYVGNRGDAKICAIDEKSLKKEGCAEMPSSPDGTFYVASTREVWVTTPRDRSIQILDVSKPSAPRLSGKIQLEGEPEGYAVDAQKGRVYTNLEDKDRTLVIDAKTRKVLSTFEPRCGQAGPRGLALDAQRGLLFVACASEGLVALDAQSGARKGQIDTGKGLDNIDYLPPKRLVYASAGQAEKLTIAEVGEDGALKKVAEAPVGKGCRVVVATEDGTAYAADSGGGKIWVVSP